MTDHADRVERAFTTQAAAFEDARYNATFTVEVDWLWEPLRLTPDTMLLDVAAGTGHAARQLAPRVRAAVALDATEAMLEQGRAQAPANVVFLRGDAAALPFCAASFDVVICRFAAHHFRDPSAVVAEMARVLRPGGQLGLADLVSVEDPDAAAEQNRLERLRDPSHATAMSPDALAALVRDAGLAVTSVEARGRERPLEPWIEQASTPAADAEAIRERLREEIAGGAPTGFEPVDADGELRFTHRFASVVATATAAGAAPA